MRKIYCGGRFYFDHQDADYHELAAQDYRAMLLGNADLLLQKSDGVQINNTLEYIGPFYFESDDMLDSDVVRCEIEMVHRCTDAIFLLDQADCPGTICELTLASMLGKRVHVFYLKKAATEETESALHTPCWYPVVFSRLVNKLTDIYECTSVRDACGKMHRLIDGWT